MIDADEKHRLPDLVPLGLAPPGQYAISSTPVFPLGEKVAKPEYWLRLKPWSLAAWLVAVAALAAAIGLRVVFAELGMSLYFATFLPAILLTALLAGVPQIAARHDFRRRRGAGAKYSDDRVARATAPPACEQT